MRSIFSTELMFVRQAFALDTALRSFSSKLAGEQRAKIDALWQVKDNNDDDYYYDGRDFCCKNTYLCCLFFLHYFQVDELVSEFFDRYLDKNALFAMANDEQRKTLHDDLNAARVMKKRRKKARLGN